MADNIENRDTSAGSKRPAAEAELATISEVHHRNFDRPRDWVPTEKVGHPMGPLQVPGV